MEKATSYIKLIENSIKTNWDLDAFTDYKASTLQYKDVARKIEKLHIIFKECGIQRGDRIALCDRNSSLWGSAFFAILTYGAVAVPILNEFNTEQIYNILKDSGARLFFTNDKIWKKLNADEMPDIEGVIHIGDYSLLLSRTEKLTFARMHLNELFGRKYPMNFRSHHVSYQAEDPEETALINYTSGSTGYSKGVMVPYRAMLSNFEFACKALPLNPGDHVLSMLPMAHMYGLAFEVTYEFCIGCHVYFLTKVPSPRILLEAFADVKPAIIICVPLIIEKIIRKRVFPRIDNSRIRIMMRMPIIGEKIRNKIKDELVKALGGNFYEVIIGGAALNQEVEMFLHFIDFPYTVGYGATECAPIISYADYKTFKPGSCGRPALNMEVKIDSAHPDTEVGEILAKGPNVMKGYYKSPEQTAQVIDKDGWYHTGDLGVMDEQGNITIKGRSKNMLLGSSGQNIYPEEIEDKLAGMVLVNECLVIQRGDRLYALVHPDDEEARKQGLTRADIRNIMEANRKELNAFLPNYSQIAGVKIMDEEFEKTPKKSIKRFLYQDIDL